MSKTEICPFKMGDKVIYKPSDKGWGYEQMSTNPLERNKLYTIIEITENIYVTVEGDKKGGLYWTEFKSA